MAGEALDEATIYLELAHAAGVPLFGSRIVQGIMRALQRWRGRLRSFGVREVPQRLLLSLLLLLTRNGSFARLLTSPHGRPRPVAQGGDFLGERVLTEDGKLRLAPPEFLAGVAKLEAAFAGEMEGAHRLRLISKRQIKTHNSWTHNDEAFARPGATNHLYMNPRDAGRLGLKNGDVADVSSQIAKLRVPVKLLAELQPGTVALPHGWGHQHALGLSAASRTAGVNVNLLSADGPKGADPLSGMAHLTGIDVEVVAAAGERDPKSWSGIQDAPSIPAR